MPPLKTKDPNCYRSLTDPVHSRAARRSSRPAVWVDVVDWVYNHLHQVLSVTQRSHDSFCLPVLDCESFEGVYDVQSLAVSVTTDMAVADRKALIGGRGDDSSSGTSRSDARSRGTVGPQPPQHLRLTGHLRSTPIPIKSYNKCSTVPWQWK